MKNNYDVVIIGAGPAGIFAARSLIENSGLKVLLVERGEGPDQRFKADNGSGRAMVTGWGGAGAFSDGKLTLTPDVGGILGDIIEPGRFARLIDEVDRHYLTAGAPEDTSGNVSADLDRLTENAQRAQMKFIPTRIRHMGTDTTQGVLRNFHQELQGKVDMVFDVQALKILSDEGRVTGVELEDGRQVKAGYVIAAPGRAGSAWLQKEAERLNLSTTAGNVDLGVRVELPAAILADLTDITHEIKLHYQSRSFDDRVRTFCMNPYGEVVEEASEGILTVNGHSYRNRKSKNTNFAILVSNHFTEPFEDPIGFGKSIARLANLLSGGVMVQRLGDLRAGRRSTAERIGRSIVQPSLASATPGDLAFVLPYRHLTDILEMIEALEKLAPGVDSPHTLLYGIEVKFYSVRFKLDDNLQSELSNLFMIGDGAGITRGLVQASASGIVAAQAIMQSGK